MILKSFFKKVYSKIFSSKSSTVTTVEQPLSQKPPRWSGKAPMARKCKQEMETLLYKARQNPSDSTLPNTKEEVYNYIGLNKNSAGDFRPWLKYYHRDFYYDFIDLFPYFSGRND